jgi:glycerol-3-phosphate dehydrogenase (NAD(P)+)
VSLKLLYLRVYTNNDLVGVELGGALKNIIAIASGIVAGMDAT